MSEIGKKTATTSDVFKIYWSEIRKYPLLLAVTFIGITVAQISGLMAPLYLRDFFNILSLPSSHTLFFLQLIAPIMIAAFWWFMNLAMFRTGMRGIMRLESRVMHNLGVRAFEYLIDHSNQFFSTNFSGALTNRITKFSSAFEVLFDTVVMQMFSTLLFVVGISVVLLMRNSTLGLIFMFWAICFVAFQVYMMRRNQPFRKARAEAQTKLVATISDTISNQNTVQLFSGEIYEKTLFVNVSENWRALTMHSWSADDLVWGGQGLLMVIIQVALFIGAAALWQKGIFGVGDFVLMQTYILGAFSMLSQLGRSFRSFYNAVADASEMVAILNEPHGVCDTVDAKPLVVHEGKIVFKDVDFFFHETRPVLQHFNLEIRAGERVALVGQSGAGKSTITKLLLRLYDVTDGRVEIDEQSIAHVTQESLRNSIAFVPQESVLFHRTLMENIRYGRRDATDEEVIEAAKQAHCHEFISVLPDGYNTLVGERGVKLSGGERQRVAIARAILKNARILVLDEATSSLDSESESLIQDALQTLMQGKTVVVIAHRLSTIMNMDRIVVMEGGMVVAEGTHDELLTQGGLYQKLWSIQAGGFLQDDGRGGGL